MWRILQNVIIPGLFSRYDLLRLLTNVYHGIAEPFENRTSAYSNIAEIMEISHLSISSNDSDSVGSISIQVEMGHETVGG